MWGVFNYHTPFRVEWCLQCSEKVSYDVRAHCPNIKTQNRLEIGENGDWDWGWEWDWIEMFIKFSHDCRKYQDLLFSGNIFEELMHCSRSQSPSVLRCYTAILLRGDPDSNSTTWTALSTGSTSSSKDAFFVSVFRLRLSVSGMILVRSMLPDIYQFHLCIRL